MKTKAEYFDEIHEKLSKEFGLSTHAIETIRSFVLGPQKLSRGQIILWIKEKMKNAGKQTIERKLHAECDHCKHKVKEVVEVPSQKMEKYQEMLAFVQKATERQWKDLTWPYEYNPNPRAV